MSLRSRLTLLTALIFAACLVVLAVFVPRMVRNSLTDRLDSDIDEVAVQAAVALGFDVEGVPPIRPGGPRTLLTNAAYAEARDLDGTLLRSTFLDVQFGAEHSAPALPSVLQPHFGASYTVGSVAGSNPAEWRVTVYQVKIGGSPRAMLVVALPMSEVDATTSSVQRIVWITSGVSLAVLAAAAWLVSGLGLRPLRRMERSAAAITDAADLGQRVEHPGTRSEIGRLGATINDMLGRLEASFSEQQATEERLRRFAADASHELRTPLTSIRGYAELYRRGGDDPDQVQRSMSRIEHEATRMGSLVDDLLLLARSDAQLPLEQHPVDLGALVEGLAADASVVEPERPIAVQVEPVTVVGDRDRLTQAVANVLANARIHTPPGTPVEVSVRVAPPLPAPDGSALPARAVVTVVDHGPGFSEEQAARVFERFYRADAARTRERGGSGLGLSITAAIVHAHGGDVSAVPTPGGGATFVISVPLAPAPAPGAGEADRAAGVGRPADPIDAPGAGGAGGVGPAGGVDRAGDADRGDRADGIDAPGGAAGAGRVEDLAAPGETGSVRA